VHPDRHHVAVLVRHGMLVMELGIVQRLFGQARSAAGEPLYEVVTCTLEPGLVRTDSDFSIPVERGPEVLPEADTVIIPASLVEYEPTARELTEPLRGALGLIPAEARIASICTGAFVLAAAGLLDGKRATTHWHYTRALAEKHRAVRVDENVLFVDEGSVLTSAGAASGIDLCLHILRGDLGMAASNHAARRLVAAPYRSGGQAQYVPRSVPEPLGERFAATREWALRRLDKPLTLDTLARHAAVSPRTFSRRFVDDTGHTPMQWVLRARVDMARELLERSQRSVEQIAADVGLGTGANLRLHFQRLLGTTPSEYRRTFARSD
jgi:transcriptional regulator GlxA family with amidase domain